MSAIISPNRGRISFFTVKQTRQILSSSSVFIGTGKSIFSVLVPFDAHRTQFLTPHVRSRVVKTLSVRPPLLLPVLLLLLLLDLILEHYTTFAPNLYILYYTPLHKNCVTNSSQRQPFAWISLSELM